MGFRINQCRIKVNREKIKTFLNMQHPTKSKLIQSVTGSVTTRSYFISKAIIICLMFFNALKEVKKFD